MSVAWHFFIDMLPNGAEDEEEEGLHESQLEVWAHTSRHRPDPGNRAADMSKH